MTEKKTQSSIYLIEYLMTLWKEVLYEDSEIRKTVLVWVKRNKARQMDRDLVKRTALYLDRDNSQMLPLCMWTD
jgi:hypothetical protein